MIKNYKVDILLASLAVFPTVISLIVDLICSNEYFWFQRSGSVMVLFAVILDFNQSRYAENKSSTNVIIQGVPALIGVALTEPRKKIQIFSIFLAVLGTFIWGYGDIPF